MNNRDLFIRKEAERARDFYKKDDKVKNIASAFTKRNNIELTGYLLKQIKFVIQKQDYKKLIATYEKNFKVNYKLVDEQIVRNLSNQFNVKEEDVNIHELNKYNVLNNKNILPSGEYKFSSTTHKPKNVKQITTQTSSSNSLDFTKMNLDEKVSITKILNRPSILRTAKLFLDSRYRDLSVTETDRISFSILQNSRNEQSNGGMIIMSGKNVRDIVRIKIQKFTIPYKNIADTYYNMITMGIIELLADSFISNESAFHFKFSSVISGNLLVLTPDNDTFEFYEPVSFLDRISLRFGAPLGSYINFDKDRLYSSNINYTSNPGEITFAEDHNLVSGDIVYISNFTSLTSNVDTTVLDEINKKSGHIISFISATVISIPIDFNRITSPDTTLSIEVYFGSKRIMIPIEIQYEMNNKDE